MLRNYLLTTALLLYLPAWLAAADEAERLRVLLVGDTGDPNIGPSVRQDLRTMRGLFESAFTEHKDRLTLDVLQGRNASRTAILDYYRKLETGPREALVFYFSGHGGTERRRGHLFQVLADDSDRPTALWRDEVRSAMLAHQPRLTVLLSDCCSDEIEFGPRERAVPEPPAWQTVRCLFLQARGVVDVNSVSEGESAVGLEDGGFFTRSLAEQMGGRFKDLDLDGDGFLHWQELLPGVQQAAQKKYAAWRKEVLPQVEKELKAAQTRAERDELTNIKDHLEKQTAQTVRAYSLPSLARLGVRVMDADGGVRVLLVHAHTPAAVAGLKPGDVIVSIGGKAISSVRDFTDAVVKTKGEVIVEYRRPGKEDHIRVEVTLPAWSVPGTEG